MKSVEKIEKEIKFLEKRMKKLYQYRDELDFNKGNVNTVQSDYDLYTLDISIIQGKIEMLEWVLKS